jgi:MFS family permease
MSFGDRLVLWLHIGFAIFTIGPVTVAISSTPRYVRKRNLAVVQYLSRMTRVFTLLSLTVLIAGLFLAHIDKDFSKPWLAVSVTLFVVAIVLLVLIMRDQHRAIGALLAPAPLLAPIPAPAPVPPRPPIRRRIVPRRAGRRLISPPSNVAGSRPWAAWSA